MTQDSTEHRAAPGIQYETCREVEALLKQHPYAILPFGSYEQHGPHASMQCDSTIADELARRVARAVGYLKLPAQRFGVSAVHRDFPGSIWLSDNLVEQMLVEIGQSLAHNGVEALWVLNGHGGNTPALTRATARLEGTLKVAVVDWWKVSREAWPEQFEPNERHHAGAEETSLLMELEDATVDSGAFEDTPLLPYQPAKVENIHDITPTGVIGKVSTATRQRGAELAENLVGELAARCRRFCESAAD